MKSLNYLSALLTGAALMLTGCEQEPVNPSSDKSISSQASVEPSNTKQGENISSRTSSAKLFDMNDRFAIEKTGANGFGKVSFTQTGGTIAVKLIQATGLLPNHDYELKVAVGPLPNGFAAIYTSACISSNPSGHWKITNFEVLEQERLSM